MVSGNSLNLVTLTGRFAPNMPPSARGRPGPARMLPFSVNQYWRDEITDELMKSHFWVDLLFGEIPDYLLENLESGEFTGAVITGELGYRNTGVPPHESQNALIFVYSIQLIDKAKPPEERLRPGAPTPFEPPPKSTHAIWRKELGIPEPKPKRPVYVKPDPRQRKPKKWVPRYLR